jgi:hypothetical protein
MEKPPKTPRPKKPLIQPAVPGDEELASAYIGLIQEKLIGRAVVEWAKLEACMGDAISRLFGLEFEYAKLIVSRMDATALIKMLRDVGTLRLLQKDFHKLSVICDKIDILREDRNLIVHGSWGRARDGTPHVLSIRIKGLEPTDVVSETFPDSRMRTLIQAISGLKWELIRLLKLDALPKKEFGPPLVE